MLPGFQPFLNSMQLDSIFCLLSRSFMFIASAITYACCILNEFCRCYLLLEGIEFLLHFLFEIELLCGVQSTLNADKFFVCMLHEVFYSFIVEICIHCNVGFFFSPNLLLLFLRTNILFLRTFMGRSRTCSRTFGLSSRTI